MSRKNETARYREFAAALLDLIGEKRDNQDRRARLAKARASIDNRDPRYWRAIDRACTDLIARSSVSCWIDRPEPRRGRASPQLGKSPLDDRP